MELGILQYWKEEDIFQRSIKQRSSVQGRAWHDAKSGDPEDTFSFYDGPPFATGLPHYGHLLAGTIKDVIPRYQTMRGKVVQRRFGWDCHGLPVENLIEKEHGIEGREQIEEMGVGKFNELCCCSVQRFTREWQEVVERMGRWVDMNWDYRTMDPDYMESIWWVFKQLHDKGLVYEGHKPMHICPRCVTPLSNFEVTQGYKDITDTSVTMKFELLEKETERKESKDSKEAKDLVLRAPENEEELAKLHELRVQEIFEPYHPDTKYDRNHPDDKHPDHELLVRMAKKKVVGTVRVDWLDEHRVAFRLIAIDRKMQGKGLGSELLQRAEDIAREKGCSEILLNAENSVIPFYKKHGFAETSQWEESPSVGSTPMSKSLGTKEKTFVLAWTTTPWTLPGNLFLAVGPKIKYTKVEFEGNHYILAKSAVEKIFKGKEYKVKGNMAANTLAGKHFKPLFPYFSETYKKDKNVFRIVAADFVATDEGTGIVHIAPGFGEDDYQIGRREKVDVLQHVTMDGKFVPEVTDFAGMDVKPIDDPGKTDRKVVDWLEKHGLLFSKEPYRHSYPHCWRCDSPLLNYATSSWFVSIEKIKEKLLSNNAKTEWIPAHLRDGRFGKWLEGARDWAISRNRYWGTPLPIWRNQETGDTEVLGSRDDLMAHAPERFTKVTVVRHGESEGNLPPIYQGIEPGTNLTKQGKEQAQATAKLLAGRGQKSENRIQIPVEIIYCSPLARTQQTAEAIAKETGAEIIVDDRLREVNFGEYEGKTVDFNDLAFVKARRAHKLEEKSPESIYHFPGMETWNDVQKRLSSFMVEMLPRHRGKHVVVVTHADVVQNAKHFFTREDPLKISHQPYPSYAEPRVFYWDHERGAQMDLHKDTVDGIVWNGGKQGPFKRIPEVLDCWFESGAMPYAQSHYPFEAGSCSLDL